MTNPTPYTGQRKHLNPRVAAIEIYTSTDGDTVAWAEAHARALLSFTTQEPTP